MRRKLRNGKVARAGICPGAGEIAGALRQSRAAKSPLQGRASGARPKTAGAGALRHSRAPNGLFTDRTGFATVTGTYTSRVMQFGDTNAPNTLNLSFSDDVHVHSDTRRAHLRHIEILLMTLRHYRFYLGSNKSEWFSKSLDSLGAIISDDGIEVDPAKWERIRQWPTPHNKTDVQRFLGTVNWMRDHLPHLSITLEAHHRIISAIDVSLVPATLRPIDGAKVTSGEHKIYLFTDASRVGIGACLASGPTRSQAIPTRFFSAKFNGAQLNYHVTDKEFLAVVSACRAFEQHLIGYPFVIVTDHQALRTIKTQKLRQTPRHIRMCLELSRFDFEFEFIAGKNNSLADSLSRLWEVKEGSPEDQVKENELEDMFFDGERHGFTTHGSPGYYALKDESQDEDVNGRDLGNLFLKEECHEFTTPGSPGSHRLAENIMDAVDSSTRSPFSSHRRQSSSCYRRGPRQRRAHSSRCRRR
ncbi:BZ3500_MvSof-1268-A1-R1_C117g00638 [Microbotryum saponariae]|uniref:BZ3500_MvSof-1268-A1-R1_C117g00638 protein n=1 Tax=Microbotryum saponariae TaxID=289078 RepID=A0A2X0KNZ6_9BASI|nr:BZ3500_MvSof-1268-A1-R1_C117g00638 [Microbotryum saponariae]